MGTLDPSTPVIIGVGQVNVTGGGAPEPAALLAEAAQLAAADAGVTVGTIGSIRVVAMLSVRSPDPGAVVADRLGIAPVETVLTPMGGNMPQLLVDRTAADIAAGFDRVALIGGAESWKTRQAARRRGERPAWTDQDATARPTRILGPESPFANEVELELGLAAPTMAYPLLEVALRHARGLGVDEHRRHLGWLWAGFAAVAAGNPYAAIRQAPDASRIATPAADNRMISFPYTKMLNSNNSVDQGAALLMCSAGRAASLGVPRDRWVFLHGAGEGNDTDFLSNRADFASSAAIGLVGRAALGAARVGIDDLARVDLYSCFPSAVQIAAAELGLTADRPLTVTGGLTFAGGPWNNYVTHSIATMVGLLREDPDAYGLCTANGGLLTKHAAGVYSCRPPARPPVVVSVQEQIDALPTVAFTAEHQGPGAIEAYTVSHDRDGAAHRAVAALRLADGSRTWAHSVDPDLLDRLLTTDAVGHAAEVAPGRILHAAP